MKNLFLALNHTEATGIVKKIKKNYVSKSYIDPVRSLANHCVQPLLANSKVSFPYPVNVNLAVCLQANKYFHSLIYVLSHYFVFRKRIIRENICLSVVPSLGIIRMERVGQVSNSLVAPVL
jgi:hypothetical protein